ncbi:MAG: hypothetical protein CJBNEKGG_04117 [Prosthecobacter sp.]|nr:hypothetical protein [Prosthecobacter sp.]
MIPSLSSDVNSRLLLIFSLAPFLHAGDKEWVRARPARVTLYVSGVECPGCTYAVSYAISQLKGVGEVVSGQMVDDFVNVTFDPRIVSVHQLAHAVFDAPALHGMPYQASLKLDIPDYSKDDNAGRVDALLQGWADWAEVEVVDRSRGRFTLKFRPLKPGGAAGPQGLSLDKIIEAFTAPAPRGIGLRLEIAAEKEPM